LSPGSEADAVCVSDDFAESVAAGCSRSAGFVLAAPLSPLFPLAQPVSAQRVTMPATMTPHRIMALIPQDQEAVGRRERARRWRIV
jgi:hypothetical protein